MATKFACIHKL